LTDASALAAILISVAVDKTLPPQYLDHNSREGQAKRARELMGLN